jgi:hypothetical protein
MAQGEEEEEEAIAAKEAKEEAVISRLYSKQLRAVLRVGGCMDHANRSQQVILSNPRALPVRHVGAGTSGEGLPGGGGARMGSCRARSQEQRSFFPRRGTCIRQDNTGEFVSHTPVRPQATNAASPRAGGTAEVHRPQHNQPAAACLHSQAGSGRTRTPTGTTLTNRGPR